MPLGIGGGAQMGIALERLAPPVQAALATATTGGTILAGTYRYVVTAINAAGETIASNEQSIVTTGSTSTVTVTWGAVTGATGYKLYKTAAGGGTGTELLYKTVGLVVSDIDTAPGAPSGALPTVNTAANPGVYVAPTKFLPFNNESLNMNQNTVWRRPIRQSVGVLGAVPGNINPEGDIEMELLEDVFIYFLYASRMTVTRTGSAPNYTYTCVPNALAIPPMTMSITIERVSGVVFGYTGMIVSSFKVNMQDGDLIYTVSMKGRDEITQAVPTPTWPITTPFGAGMYTMEIPTGTVVNDTDGFELSVDDNGTPEFRMKNTGRGADFIHYGERSCELTLMRDFLTRADYDAWRAYTGQAVHMLASRGINNSVDFVLNTAIKDTYEVALGAQGDLVRANIKYQCIANASGQEFTITVKTQELV
jgi:hypothetical protein